MISSSSATGGRAAFARTHSMSRSLPNSSPSALNASVTPSENTTTRSPGSSVTVSCSYLASGKTPTIVPPDHRRRRPDGPRTIGGWWPALVYVSLPSLRQRPVEERDEPPLDRLSNHRLIERGERGGRGMAERGFDREHPLHHRRQQRRRQAFARDVAQHEPEPAIRQVDVVEEIAADGQARH